MAVALLGRLLCVAVLVSSSSAQETPRNVALNKPASQSSAFNGTDGSLTYRASADLAVDGAPTKRYEDKTCAVTDWQHDYHCQQGLWWQVNLGELYDVLNVTIFQRGEGANNFGPLVVRVGDHVQNPENRTVYIDSAIVRVILSPPVTASSVNISITSCGILQLCEVEVFGVRHLNECASNPCQHGGNCTDGFLNYTCHCVRGYAGVNCDTDVNECASHPCQHGGSCTDAVAGYICVCVPGYTGVNCETDADECASNPCQHGGNCTDSVSSYKCDCAPGYASVNCETACSGGTFGPGCSKTCSPHCLESSDRGGQHCDRTTGQCLLQTGCKDGFQGLQCDTKQQICPAVSACTDRYTEGLGTGLGVGLGTSLLLALGTFALLRFRRLHNSPAKRRAAGDIQLSPRQVQSATRQQEVSPGQGGFYESLDDATKDQDRSGPYAELGEARVGQETASPYSNVSA